MKATKLKVKSILNSYGEAVYQLDPPYQLNKNKVDNVLLSVMSGSKRIDIYSCLPSGTLTNANAILSLYEMYDHKSVLAHLGYELES